MEGRRNDSHRSPGADLPPELVEKLLQAGIPFRKPLADEPPIERLRILGLAADVPQLVVLLDDLGMTPPTTQQVKTALEGWLRAGPRPEDEITLLTTSGDIWWADTIGAGRQDQLGECCGV